MTEQEKEIKANNQLIAMFMGAYPASFYDGNEITWVYEPSDLWGNQYAPTEYLHYHDSWDWILTAVKKIEEIVQSNAHQCGGSAMTPIHASLLKYDLSATFRRVLEFITDYNKHNGNGGNNEG